MAKKITDLVLLLNKNITKLVFLWSKMSQKCFKVLRSCDTFYSMLLELQYFFVFLTCKFITDKLFSITYHKCAWVVIASFTWGTNGSIPSWSNNWRDSLWLSKARIILQKKFWNIKKDSDKNEISYNLNNILVRLFNFVL